VQTGTDDTSYITLLEYAYNSGTLETVTYKSHIVINYEYVGGLLKKVIEPDLSESVNNKHGRVTWLEWADSNRLLRMKVGLPRGANPDYGSFGQEPDEEDYYWQVTEFDYTLVGGRQLLSSITEPGETEPSTEITYYVSGDWRTSENDDNRSVVLVQRRRQGIHVLQWRVAQSNPNKLIRGLERAADANKCISDNGRR